MKSIIFSSALLLLGTALGNVLPSAAPGSEMAADLGGHAKFLARRGCTANNCARAVTGTAAKPALTVRQSDCSSFMRRTVLFPTTTVTQMPQRRQQTIIPGSVPSYASACNDVSQYSSACSCWGITATTVTVRPTATVVPTTLTGVLQVRDSNGNSLGYVTTDPNYWTPLLNSDKSGALVVSFVVPTTPTTNSELTIVTNGNAAYPFFGFVQGRDSTDAVEQPGSYNYLYLDPTAHTNPGSAPQVVNNYFNTVNGLSHSSESSVWNINVATGAVTPLWINPDGNPAASLQLFLQSNHVYAGSDPGAFKSRFPAPVTTGITFTFVPN
ncbi:hypothetical protein BP5796_12272 [Coleophoma crateriformis]|uniref:Uncharacterized protein n=1 Tax=Coleophoma crateriformis TaxID=565419 RepID=A0A3D8Q929_9HELO|nr:hypothetical protein BP5796_12272 [Coleophoma crateriformis]